MSDRAGPRCGPPWATALVFALLAFAPVGLAAQGTVTGVVQQQGTERPLDAAQVFIPGTGIGTLTNSSGRFLLVNVPAGPQTIRVELVGFSPREQTVEVTSGETSVVEFNLPQTAIELDEVVVTGAGQATQKKKLGNTVATVNVDQLEAAPTNNISEVLQGREPGVALSSTGGMAGEGSQIRIRGSSSLSQTNEPIIYIDGVRVSNASGFGGVGEASRLDDINPDAIERIEILKGAAAATLYGTEASNGVIQIFTKRGQAGDPRWEISVEQGFSDQDMSRYAPHAGFVRTQEDANRVADFWNLGSLQPFEVFVVDDIYSRMFETGYHQAYSASVRGGSDFINYYVSGRYGKEDGAYGAEDLGPTQDIDEQKQANANVTIFPTQDLQIRFNTMYTERYHEIPSNGNDIFGGFSLALMSKPELATEGNVTGVGAFTTVRETMQIFRGEDTQRFAGSLTTNYTPIANLALDATMGVDVINQQGTFFKGFGWNVDGVAGDNPQGEKEQEDINRRQLTFDLKGTWNTDLSEDFTSSLVVGGQLINSELHENSTIGEQFPGPGLEVTEAGAQQSVEEEIVSTVNAGAYVQEQIGYRDFLFATVGARFDKHSAFGESAGAAVYPKASVSFVPSDMLEWDNSTLSSLRIRGAIGQSGLQPEAFDKFTTFNPLPAAGGPGVEPDNLGNDDLKPEVSTEWELGGEVGLFENRAALNVTYWNRTVTDVLVNRQFAPSGGFLNTQLANIGEMKAYGVELGLNGSLYESRNLSVNLFANGSYLQEEVTDMGGAPALKIDYYRYRTWIAEGYAPGAFFSHVLADVEHPFDTNADDAADSRAEILEFLSEPRSPDDLTLFLAEPNPDGPGGEYYRGKPVPDWQGSFGADISLFSNFQLTTLFEYKAGNFHVQDLSGAFRNSHALLGRNTEETARVEAILQNPGSTPEQRLEAAQEWAREIVALSPYSGLNAIKDADFLRWRELSLTYNLPGDFLERIGGMDRMALTFGARNLKLWTKYPGIDPENNVVSRSNFLYGIDGWRPGLPRRFTFSARVGF